MEGDGKERGGWREIVRGKRERRKVYYLLHSSQAFFCRDEADIDGLCRNLREVC